MKLKIIGTCILLLILLLCIAMDGAGVVAGIQDGNTGRAVGSAIAGIICIIAMIFNIQWLKNQSK